MNSIILFTHTRDRLMPKDKTRHLKDQGTLNRRADSVKAPSFLENPFFDPHDLIQVKYEMLRAVEKEGQPVKRAAEHFGLSRPTFYETKRAMEQEGLTGLIPKKTGPKNRHKLTSEVLDFVHDALEKDHTLKAQDLAKRIKRRFATQVHPRSIERALAAQKKRTNSRGAKLKCFPG